MLAMLSLPARLPATIHSSRTLLVGGSRSAMVRKNSRSLSDIGKAKAAFKTMRQLSQLDPAKNGWNSKVEFIAATILMCLCLGFFIQPRALRHRSQRRSGRGFLG